mgnify:FL=1
MKLRIPSEVLWKTKSLNNGEINYKYSAEFEADYWKLLTTGWDIDVKCVDVNGNGIYGNSHLDGILEGIIKAILAFLFALWEAVKELASKLFSWIWEMVKSMFLKIFEPVYKAITSCQIGLANLISSVYSETSPSLLMASGGEGGSDLDPDDVANNTTGSGLGTICLGIMLVWYIIVILLVWWTAGILSTMGSILKKTFSDIVTNIMQPGGKLGFGLVVLFTGTGLAGGLEASVLKVLSDYSLEIEWLIIIIGIVIGMLVAYKKGTNLLGAIGDDAIAFVISLIGGFISFGLAKLRFDRYQEGAIRLIGIVLGIVGLIWGLKGIDIPAGILGWLDEMASGLLLGISIGNFILFM